MVIAKLFALHANPIIAIAKLFALHANAINVIFTNDFQLFWIWSQFLGLQQKLTMSVSQLLELNLTVRANLKDLLMIRYYLDDIKEDWIGTKTTR